MDENHQHTIVPRLDPNPQPNTIRTSLNATTIIEVKESMCEGQNSSSTTIDTDDQRKSLEFLKNKYSLMRKELFEARSRIEELEETLVVSRLMTGTMKLTMKKYLIRSRNFNRNSVKFRVEWNAFSMLMRAQVVIFIYCKFSEHFFSFFPFHFLISPGAK